MKDVEEQVTGEGIPLFQKAPVGPDAPGVPVEPVSQPDEEGVDTLRLQRGQVRDPVGEIRLDRAAQEGGGQVFASRRQRDVVRNLLTQFGARNDYVSFFPARVFMRYLGPYVRRLNEAFETLKKEHPDALALGLYAELREHDSGLRKEVQAARELLVQVVQYCEKGFEGDYENALAMDFLANVPEIPDRRQAPVWEDHFKGERDALAQAGVLTSLGVREGLYAYKPCVFFGRFLADLTIVSNEWMLRAENNAAQNMMSGGEPLGRFFERLDDVCAHVAGGLDRVINEVVFKAQAA